jgi:hypothetical protein
MIALLSSFLQETNFFSQGKRGFLEPLPGRSAIFFKEDPRFPRGGSTVRELSITLRKSTDLLNVAG